MLRSAGAVFLGLVAVFVLSLATDQALHSLDVYPPWGQPMYDTGLCLLALSYRIVYGTLALTALPAPGWAVRCTTVDLDPPRSSMG